MYLEKITRKDLENLYNIRKNLSSFWKIKNLSGLFLIKDNNKTIGLISLRNNKDYIYQHD